MLSIVYASRASGVFSDANLLDLLLQSRRNNRRLSLSGMLIYRAGIFLQVIEGPDEAVRHRMSLIATDPRHGDIDVLLEEDIEERMFPAWTMGYADGGADSGAETAPGLHRAFADLADGRSVTHDIPALRSLIRWFQVNAA